MTDTEDDKQPHLPDWKARLDDVRRENQALFVYVTNGEDNGTISKEASRRFFRASVDVMRRAGIVEPQMSGQGVGDALLCAVVAQANHEARQSLVNDHPELAEDLRKQVPSAGKGRER